MKLPNDTPECRALEHLIVDYKEALKSGVLTCHVTR